MRKLQRVCRNAPIHCETAESCARPASRLACRAVELSPKEYALLEFLLRNPGRPVTRAAIIEEVWRIHGDSITNVVDVYINYLRRKIDTGADHPLIRTVRGVGYQIGGNHHPG